MCQHMSSFVVKCRIRRRGGREEDGCRSLTPGEMAVTGGAVKRILFFRVRAIPAAYAALRPLNRLQLDKGPPVPGDHHAFALESAIDQLGHLVLGFGNVVGAHGLIMAIACLLCPRMLQRSACSGIRLSRVRRKVGERSIWRHHCRKHVIRNNGLRGPMDCIHVNRVKNGVIAGSAVWPCSPFKSRVHLASIHPPRSAAAFRMSRRSG